MAIAPYHYPATVYIKQDNPDIPTFNFDNVINPISAYRVEKFKSSTELSFLEDSELAEFEIGDGFQPLFADRELSDH